MKARVLIITNLKPLLAFDGAAGIGLGREGEETPAAGEAGGRASADENEDAAPGLGWGYPAMSGYCPAL